MCNLTYKTLRAEEIPINDVSVIRWVKAAAALAVFVCACVCDKEKRGQKRLYMWLAASVKMS